MFGRIDWSSMNPDSMKRLRISAISYLNTAPLMWDFEHGETGTTFDISYTLPSQCARELAEGSADIGIIPAAAYTSIPDLKILPGVAIASKRAVRSILLVSKVPLEQVQTVALDTSSMTSVALTKVLFAKFWGGGRVFAEMNPDLENMLEAHDAALLIGDPALQVDRSRYITFDLAEEWIRFTGKPFVFAFWAIRREAIENTPSETDLTQVFQNSRDHGLNAANLNVISQQWAARLDLTEDNVRRYLTENIHYYLDARCLDGLQLFYLYAQECGALPATPTLDFLDTPKPAVVQR
jgi:chorismate dehydratase